MIDLDTMRRGACPTLSAPMETGDGLLSRVALTAPATPDALIALCQAAISHGNGMLDISARGNLQARGLSAISAPLFEAQARGLDLPLRDGIAIDTGPLCGLDPTETTDPRPLAQAIREGVARAGLSARLSPKTAVVVDGGGALTLAALLADIRLKAHGEGWLLMTGGTEETALVHGVLSQEGAVGAALALLARMAEGGRRFRGRDLDAHAVRECIGASGALLQGHKVSAPRKPLGLFALRNGLAALGVAPAFAQIEAARLAGFLAAAKACGIALVRPAPGHALLLIGPAAACADMPTIAERHGFLLRADDPRAAIAVCPGSPGCRSAQIDTHALAAAISDLPPLLDGSFTLHVSGCAKGCAHPEPALLTLTAGAENTALAFNGKASDAPAASLATNRVPEALRRLSALIELRREAGETAAQCLHRLGFAGIGSTLA